LQEQLTAALEKAAVPGEPAAAVAMNPTNGQVLAMASVPSYNDNIFGPPVDVQALQQAESASGDPMLEHATQTVAPPGSTFKLVVAAADAKYRVIPPHEVIPTGYTFTFDGHTYHSWADLPPMDLPQSIGWSNDVYFYKLAVALGAQRIYDVGRDLGVGRLTGIDLPGESAGYFGSPGTVAKAGGIWYPGNTVILGIGQGAVEATPMQDDRWTAAVATGQLVTPRLGLAVASPGAHPEPLPAPAPQPLPFASELGVVRDGMRYAVTNGIATAIKNLPVAAGAKTGTAQDPSNPDGHSDAWFTAAAPISNPAVVMTALVRGGGDGDASAGPVVDAGLQYFFSHEAQILSSQG
jgi:cell division protein FtsI/penicillin-binding protein 2